MLPPLAGLVIGVTADRRADEQAELLHRRGAEVMLAPVIRTRPLADGPDLVSATEALIARPPDTLVVLTGLGIRSWFEAAEGRGRGDDLVAAMTGARILARGPKAAGALATLGLEVAWRAQGATSEEVEEHLGPTLTGRRIAVQRDGAVEPRLALSLGRRGAEVVDVPVYRWELPHDRGPAHALLEAIVARHVDAVTFTSAAAVTNLFALAADRGGDTAVEEIRDALRGPVLPICVGPVSAARLVSHGVDRPIHPDRWRLGPMVHRLARLLEQRRRSFTLAGSEAVVQGTALAIDDERTTLSRREAQLLTALVDAGGAVVTKERLVRTVWAGGGDSHLVEVTVARLRRRLGAAATALHTVPRRGYRLAD